VETTAVSARRHLIPLSTAIIVVCATGLALGLRATFATQQYVNEPLHSSIEAIGGCIALGMSALLLIRWLEDGPAHFLWMSTALVMMGVLDLAHACSERSPAFFWSRALPTFLGGALMAMVWLAPSKRPRAVRWLRPPLIAAVLAAPLALHLVLAPFSWPNAFAHDGGYYWWAKALNVLGGAAFATAAVFFLRRNARGEYRDADLVFGNHCVIFAVAGFLFGLSHIWGAVWWLLHGLRLAAYIVVLKYSIDVFRRAHRESAELRQIEFERRLVGIVGHDLRNPLNAVLLSSQILQGMELPARATSVLQRLTHSANRMSRLVAELLDFSQSRIAGRIPIHRAEVDLASLCETVRDEFAASHPSVVTACDCTGDTLGQWDRERLHQALVNLVENGIKHGDKTSPIIIKTRAERDQVTLEVHSRGTPIPRDLLPHIFKPFRSGGASESRTRSHGLGLFIVHEIVRGHGGQVSVESSQEHGTCFRIVLPRE
jgi:signal transduction histidine kinase